MGADGCVLFYGIAYTMRDDEYEALERRTHSAMRRSREVGLRHFWEQFAPGEPSILLVGAELGYLGPEGKLKVSWEDAPLRDLLDGTMKKLTEGGFDGQPALHAFWLCDS